MTYVIDTQAAIRDLQAQFQGLRPAEAAKAISRALNRAIVTARSESRKEVRKIYNIPTANLNKQMTMQRSTERTLTASLKASSAYTPLTAFNPRVVSSQGVVTKRTKGAYSSRKLKRVRKGTTGVTIEIKKGQRQRLPSAFLANVGGRSVIMARGEYNSSRSFTWRNKRISPTGNDLPIEGLKTVSVFKAVINGDALKGVNEAAQRTFHTRIIHELNQGLKYK